MANPIKDLGPCSITFNNVDLGNSLGGVIFRYTEESKPVTEDQKGVTEVDGIVVGVSACEVEIPFTRTSLAVLSTLISNNTYAAQKLAVSNPVGVSMYDGAYPLILKPIIANVASTDNKTWLTLHKAYPRPDMEIVYNNEGQRVYKVMFKCFPVLATGAIFDIGV